MPKITELSSFANGAMNEEVNHALQKVIENIADPNTDPKKARKVTVTLTLKSDSKREEVSCEVGTKFTIAPPEPLSTKLIIGTDDTGKIVGQELLSGVPGQMYINDNTEVATDTGEVVDSETGEVIDFQKSECKIK